MDELDKELSICDSSGMKKVEAYMKRKKEKQSRKSPQKNQENFIVVDDRESQLQDLNEENLRKKEIELRLQIDELEEEIYRLERLILGEPVSDEEEREEVTENKEDTLLSEEEDGNKKRKSIKSKNDSERQDMMKNESEDEWIENIVQRLTEFEAPKWCVPIKANVLNFEWDKLATLCQFDAILMDPPWQLATHAPTRGVALGYSQLPDVCIEELPIERLQTNGFIFIWVINVKYVKAFELMKKWGYIFVDDITWVKRTVNRRMAKGHGYYLQHAKETCLVGRKGMDPPNCKYGIGSDVIFAERRGQSQKPEELYELVEELVPNGTYLEIFGRKNNLRDYWVTIGNEL